jgi:branched-chain amino acid transport system ATP-binding protein
MCPEPLLEVRALSKSFGGLQALGGVNLSLAEGEILGLVGPNGSGKTTLINAVSGLLRPDKGEIRFGGRSLLGLHPHQRVHLGISRTFQSPKPFAGLSTLQNLEVAWRFGSGRRGPPPQEVLAALGLEKLARRDAASLNSAQQKKLDLARALATGPKLLLVDELGAGLNAAELSEMADFLGALAVQGVALLVVEHLLGFLDRLTKRLIVLNAGREIFEGDLQAAAQDPQVVAVFLGEGGA